jgi:hypothetical protein
VLELPAFLLRRLPSFLGQVVTLMSHANRVKAARHQGRRHWICHHCVNLPAMGDVSRPFNAFTPTRNHFVNIGSSVSCCSPSFRRPRLHHTFKNQSQKAKAKNPKIQKQKNNKKGMAHEIPSGIL